MFGFNRKRPVQLIPFSESKPRTFNTLLCDSYLVRNVASLDGLIAALRHLQKAHLQYRVLASLDDLNQAGYTSGHCIDTHNLDDIEGHDLSGLDPAAFEAGEHIGYLSTLSEFPVRLANLMRQVTSTAISDAAGILFWSEPGMTNDLVSANRDPDAALDLKLEKEIIVQLVPVDSGAETLAAFPNGYFTCDLNPIQNYAIARHLEQTYALSLFGVGSRWLGFWRDSPFDPDTAGSVARDMAGLFGEVPNGSVDALAELLTGKDHMLMRYTET